MNPQAVIFDMDGLLMDSERIGLTVLHECALLQAVNIPLDMIRTTLGATRQSASALYNRHFSSLDTDRLFDDFRLAMQGLAKAGKIPLKPGAEELLQFLQAQGIPRAVASSSGLGTIRVYLEAAGVLDAFDALISANGLASKPAPDVFFKAAEALHAAPEGCLVLEDSANGVQAGRAAGMTVFMVPDMIPYAPALAPYVDRVLPSLSAVIPLLAP